MSRRPETDSALTTVILTRNEAARLPACLAAIPERYPVLVVDCGSSDGTADLALAAGCRVISNPWPGFAAQRNFALTQGAIHSPWVLFIDADEIFPPEFYQWFEQEAVSSQDFDIGQVSSWLIFKGRLLRHAPAYPMYHPRLARRGHVHFVINHSGHGEAADAGARQRFIDIPYRHDWFNGDLKAWLTKHVALAEQEAELHHSYGHLTPRARLSLLLQSALLRVPGRFLFHYVWRRGFLDGRAGLEYAMMYAWFEMTKGLFRLVRQRRW